MLGIKRKDSGRRWLSQIFLILASLLTAPIALAHPDGLCTIGPWRPFATLGGGIAFTTNIGRTTTLPDPITGGVDVINASHGLQTVGAVDGFFGVEWDFHPMWGLQFGLGYNQTSSYEIDGTGIQGRGTPSVNTFDYHYKIVARQYLAKTQLLFNICGCYHPYIVLGAGISQNSAFSYHTNAEAFITQPLFANQTTSSFSYNVGFGIDFDALRNVRLGLGYRFADFGKVQLGNAVVSPGFSGRLSQSNFYIHELLASITFILS